MQSEAQNIARLKSMIFLIEEALRIADEGENPIHGAKLSDCLDCMENALSSIRAEAASKLATQFVVARPAARAADEHP